MKRTPLSRNTGLSRHARLARRSRKPGKQAGYRRDAEWSRAVCGRAGWVCELCGTGLGGVQAHHLISRRHGKVRWEPQNGACLCVNCHGMAHERQGLFAEAFAIRSPARWAAWQMLKVAINVRSTLDDVHREAMKAQ